MLITYSTNLRYQTRALLSYYYVYRSRWQKHEIGINEHVTYNYYVKTECRRKHVDLPICHKLNNGEISRPLHRKWTMDVARDKSHCSTYWSRPTKPFAQYDSAERREPTIIISLDRTMSPIRRTHMLSRGFGSAFHHITCTYMIYN